MNYLKPALCVNLDNQGRPKMTFDHHGIIEYANISTYLKRAAVQEIFQNADEIGQNVMKQYLIIMGYFLLNVHLGIF